MKKVKNILQSIKNNQLTRIYGITVSYKLIVVIITFLNSILINRTLGVELRGEYTTIINWASLLQLFLNLGIGSAYPAIKRRYPEKSKSVFSTLFFAIAGVYAVAFVIIGGFFDADIRYILLVSYTLTLESVIIFIALVENVTKKNFINIITATLHTVILLVIFLFCKGNLDAVLWAVIIDHIVLTFALVYYNKIWKFDLANLNKDILIEITRISIPALLMNMLMYMNYHADILFLSAMTSDSYVVGLYGTAVTLGNMLWIIPDAFKDILFNRAARKDNPEEILAAIFGNMIICLVVLIGFIVLGKWFLGFMYGEEFIDAYLLVLLLFIGTFPMALYKLIHPIYIANGKTGIVVLLLSIAVGVNFIGNLILIPIYSGVGAAISSIVSYMICGVAFFIKFKHDYDIKVIGTLKYIGKFIIQKK